MTPNGSKGDRTTLLVPAEDRHPAPCAHTVQFYGDDAFLLDAVSRFIGAAVETGDAGIVVATTAHRNELAARLATRGIDVARAVSQGQYVGLDAAEALSTFMVDGWPDAARFADLIGGAIARATTAATRAQPRVAIFGELVALLSADGQHEAAVRLEHLWNDLAQTHAFDLHCAYPMSSFCREEDGGPLEKICAAHARVIPSEGYTALTDETERLRTIALLQQKAQALETEIGERKRAQEALQRRNHELRAAVAARDEFLSVAAHELKTPVTSLRAFAQLLLRDARGKHETAPERLEVALDAIERQTGKLNHLVSRLLDTTQIEAGKLRLVPVTTDLVALVRSAVAAQGGAQAFVLDCPEQLEAVVDPVRFEQVIANLLENAVKFGPRGGVVTVELGHGDDGGIRLAVTDQGVGIPPDQREQVFDRFHQAHGERHLCGMGLGLSIAREIVELHGGRVRIEEPAGGGARFVVTLPPSAGGARR